MTTAASLSWPSHKIEITEECVKTCFMKISDALYVFHEVACDVPPTAGSVVSYHAIREANPAWPAQLLPTPQCIAEAYVCLSEIFDEINEFDNYFVDSLNVNEGIDSWEEMDVENAFASWECHEDFCILALEAASKISRGLGANS